MERKLMTDPMDALDARMDAARAKMSANFARLGDPRTYRRGAVSPAELENMTAFYDSWIAGERNAVPGITPPEMPPKRRSNPCAK